MEDNKKEERYIAVFDNYDGDNFIYDCKEGLHLDGFEFIADILNEKHQRISDLEAKLAEKEHSIGILNQHLTDKAIEIERLGEELKELQEYHDKYPYSYSEEYMLNNKELKQQLAKKEKLLKKYVATSCPINQDKIELLEKANARIKGLAFKLDKCLNKADCIEDCVEIIDTLIKEIKGE